MGRLPLIVSYVLILLKAHSTWHLKHTHTHTHTSIYLNIQHDISFQTLTLINHVHQSTLAYIYHGNHLNTSPSIHIISSHPKQQKNQGKTWQQGINH